MFQFLRRVSGAFLPRPDRPWNDDATSHAPTIGRKRRHSDGDASAPSPAKKTKNNPECDSVSEGVSPRGEEAPPPVEGQDIKEVTTGVKEVDLKDTDVSLDASSIQPEAVPLPDSPSRSPEPESESQELSAGSDEDEGPADEDEEGSVASTAPEAHAEESAEMEPLSTTTDAKADEVIPVQEFHIAVEPGLCDAPDILEVKA